MCFALGIASSLPSSKLKSAHIMCGVFPNLAVYCVTAPHSWELILGGPNMPYTTCKFSMDLPRAYARWTCSHLVEYHKAWASSSSYLVLATFMAMPGLYRTLCVCLGGRNWSGVEPPLLLQPRLPHGLPCVISSQVLACGQWPAALSQCSRPCLPSCGIRALGSGLYRLGHFAA